MPKTILLGLPWFVGLILMFSWGRFGLALGTHNVRSSFVCRNAIEADQIWGFHTKRKTPITFKNLSILYTRSIVPDARTMFAKGSACNFHAICAIPYCISWWRHQMETFSALLVICADNSPVSGDYNDAIFLMDVIFIITVIIIIITVIRPQKTIWNGCWWCGDNQIWLNMSSVFVNGRVWTCINVFS